MSICKLKFARYFYFVKSICFPFGQTRYDMNSRCVSNISSRQAYRVRSTYREFARIHIAAVLCTAYKDCIIRMSSFHQKFVSRLCIESTTRKQHFVCRHVHYLKSIYISTHLHSNSPSSLIWTVVP